MQTKKCIVCGLDRPLKQFSKHIRAKDGHDSRCKICVKAKNRSYYASKGYSQRRIDAQRYISQIKRAGCSICPEKAICCLDFHHTKDKIFTVAQKLLLNKGLVEEISKCILLCANCHRKAHNNLIDVSHIPTINPPTLQEFYRSK